MKTTRNTRRPSLNVESMEGREVPAGLLMASISPAGVLSLTGSEQAETVTIKVNGNDVVLTPNATTSINGQTMGMAQTITGAATSLKADLKGGDDVLKIDTMSNFSLPKEANINLGNGDNTLSLATTEKVDLGSLAVEGGDGKDTVAVFGGAGKNSIIHGSAAFDYGAGSSDTTFADTTYAGAGGVSVKSAVSGGDAVLNLANVNVTKTFSASFPNDTASAYFTNGSFGGVSLSKATVSNLELAGTTVTGNVAESSPYMATLKAGSATIGGNVAITGKLASTDWTGKNSVGKNVKQTGVIAELMMNGAATDALTVTGNVTLAGGAVLGSIFDKTAGDFQSANLAMTGFTSNLNSTGGDFAVKNLSLNAGLGAAAGFSGGEFSASGNVTVSSKTGTAAFDAGGSKATIDGNLTISAPLATGLAFQTTGKSEMKGNVMVSGGSSFDTVDLSSTFHAYKNVTLKLKDGTNKVNVGDTTAQTVLNGNLTITTGAGDDTLNFVQAVVNGTTSILTGAGADTFDADYGSQFKKAFSLDLGAGDDVFDIARTKGAMINTFFASKAVVKGGAGNDQMYLGSGLFGDAHTQADFLAGQTILDGGSGYNTFDSGLFSDYTGVSYGGGSIVNFTDPSP